MSKEIIVFIEGPAPTTEDKELYVSVSGTQFLYAALCGDIIVKHKFATAVNKEIIPDGYTTTFSEVEQMPQAPSTNPTAPIQGLPVGGLGIQAVGTTDRAPVATSGLQVPTFAPSKDK